MQDFLPSAGRNFQVSQFTQEHSPPPKVEIEHPELAPTPHQTSPTPPPPNYFITAPNEFGLYCIYQQHPSYIPDIFLEPEDFTDAPLFDAMQDNISVPKGLGEHFGKEPAGDPPFAPFKSEFDFRTANWFLDSREKSYNDMDDLVHGK